jgi:hypothetical protein
MLQTLALYHTNARIVSCSKLLATKKEKSTYVVIDDVETDIRVIWQNAFQRIQSTAINEKFQICLKDSKIRRSKFSVIFVSVTKTVQRCIIKFIKKTYLLINVSSGRTPSNDLIGRRRSIHVRLRIDRPKNRNLNLE